MSGSDNSEKRREAIGYNLQVWNKVRKADCKIGLYNYYIDTAIVLR